MQVFLWGFPSRSGRQGRTAFATGTFRIGRLTGARLIADRGYALPQAVAGGAQNEKKLAS